MEVVILPTPADVGLAAAHIVAALVRRQPACVLGLATGETPLATYAELVRMHREEALSFATVTTFNLDEYVGVDPAHPASYHRYMAEQFFDHVDIDSAHAHLPDGMAQDLERACTDYEAAITAAGGIDLQLLGIGEDGHIGFNEPASSLGSRTRIKTLAELTRARQQGHFAPREPPLHVLTMGVATILQARRCLLLACGQHKAAAVAKAVEGPLTAMVPASALQLHAVTTVLLDEAAASGLALADYYRDVHRHKPAWQRQRDGM